MENFEIKNSDSEEAAGLYKEEADITHRLPLELWLEILNYIDSERDVKNLSLVSKKFHGIVDKSPEAMKLLVLRLHSQMMERIQDTLLNTRRNYRSIQLHCFNKIDKLSAYPEVTEKLGKSLRKLDLRYCELTEKELIDVLKLSHKHLNSLCISNTEIKKMSDYTHESFKLNNLKELQSLNNNCDMLTILYDHIPDTCDSIYADILEPSLVDVVKMQKNLKKFDISFSESPEFDKIFGDPKIRTLKLETLGIWSSNSSDHYRDTNGNLRAFLKSQVAGLKTLVLQDLPTEKLSNVFKFMPKLETLEIRNWDYCPIFANANEAIFRCPALKKVILDFPFTGHSSSIEILSSSSSSYSDFMKRFANENVGTLQMKSEAGYVVLQLIASAFPKCKTIQFDKFKDDSFKNVVLPNVDELRICGVSMYVRPFYNPKREKISDMHYTFEALENLKILRILGNVQIDSKSLVWLLINFTKLEELQIKNGEKLHNLHKLSSQFKNLKFLFISNYGGNDIEKFRQRLAEIPSLKRFRVINNRYAGFYFFSESHYSDGEPEDADEESD